MKTFFIRNLVVGILLIQTVLTGCTSIQNTYAEVDTSIDFTSFNTFAWLPRDSTNQINVLYESPMVQEKLMETVSSELISRGLSPASEVVPDLLLQFTIIIEPKQQIVSSPQYNYVPVYQNQPNLPAYIDPYYSSYPYDYSYSFYNPPGNYYYPGPNNMNYSYNYLNYNFPYSNAYRPVVSGNTFQQVEFKEGTIIIDVIDQHSYSLIWRGWSQGNFTNPIEFKNEIGTVVQYIFERFPLLKIRQVTDL